MRSQEYIPAAQYIVDGSEYNTNFIKAYTSDTYKTGQTVEVKYNPKKPAEINRKGTSNKADLVILCIGALLGIAGVVYLLLKAK